MWIASVIIVFIIFMTMFFNRGEEESVFVIAGLLLAVIIRLGSFTSRLTSEFQRLEQRYLTLEEEFKVLKSSEKATEVIKEELLPVIESTKDVEITTTRPQAEYFENRIKSQVKEFKSESEIKETYVHTPSGIDNAIRLAIGYFTKGNPLVKIGSVLLFFGLSFLIKFAAGNNMVSIEMGLISAVVFAFVLIGIGWKLRERTGSFGLILQGTGIAIFYLSIFSSAKYFDIMPFSLALGIMVLTVIFASFIAVAQNSMSLVIFATAGGFISPILTSTGEGSHIILFSYYALLNIGIISIAWFKSWRPLNLTGFAFTFIISLIWGASRYTPEFFWSTEPFLIFFFLLYVGVSVIFSYKSEYKLKAYVDSSLLFGVPATAFAMQGALVKDTEYALSFSALAVAAFYLSLSWMLRKKDHMSLLSESFLALGVVFVTLAVPFALNGHWTAVTWTLEATAIIWISLRQDRFYARAFAVVLQILAGGVFFADTVSSYSSTLILNNIFFGGIIISIAAFLTSFVFEKNIDRLRDKEKVLIQLFMGLAVAWWIFASVKEIYTHFDYFLTYVLAFVSLSAVLFTYLSKRVQWKTLEEVLVGFFPLGLAILFLSIDMFDRTHPFIGAGWFAIPLFLMTHYLLLYNFNWKSNMHWHVGGLWISVLIFTWELSYHISHISLVLSYAVYPLLAILAIAVISPKRDFWPLDIMHSSYHSFGLAGISVFLIVSNIYIFGSSALIKGIGYIPFLNPLDIMQLVSILAVIYWLSSSKEGLFADRRFLYIFSGVSLISFLTVVLARSIHFYADVPYRTDKLLQSDVFQASISILYTILALVLIVFAKRKVSRTIWIVGASLLGFVTLKLFLVELSHSGTLSRIVSFITVGVLILIIGYLAPLPPKQESES